MPERHGITCEPQAWNDHVEIGRDFEYLLRLWDEIRNHPAIDRPALIYEASLTALIRISTRVTSATSSSPGRRPTRRARAFMRTLTPGT
jgi:hypothetical protein